jgi:hypothetical protein
MIKTINSEEEAENNKTIPSYLMCGLTKDIM